MTTREMSDYEILAAMEVFKLRKLLDEAKELIEHIADKNLRDCCTSFPENQCEHYHELAIEYIDKWHKGEK